MKGGTFTLRGVVIGVLLVLASIQVFSKDNTILRKMDDKTFASLRDKYGAVLDIRADSKDELLDLVQIYSGRLDLKSPWKRLEITRINSKRGLLPYRFLSPPFRRKFVEKLWPKNKLSGTFYIHHISYPHESLWSLSSWFTGSGQNYKKIKKANHLRSDSLRKGKTLKIPADLIFPFLQADPNSVTVRPPDPVTKMSTPLKAEEQVSDSITAPVVSRPTGEVEPPPENSMKQETPHAEPQTESQRGETAQITQLDADERTLFTEILDSRRLLNYGADSQGRYAEYHLQRGEAIYSAVVVRFCGLVRGEEVNKVASEIVVRNHIPDVTDMPVGQKLRIPYDLLIPEYRAADDPDFLEWMENLKAVENVDTSLLSKGLDGVLVILDSGHGGRDPGAKKGNTWEDDYVYDILCRVKSRLEKNTLAKVLPTIKDPSIGYSAQDVEQFNLDRDEILNTKPFFSLRKDTKLGVNLRWVFANHHFQERVNQGHRPDQVVFISFHADSLHPSLRGSMVYVPDARSYPRSKVNAASVFKPYGEYKNSSFRATKKEMERAQALSTRLGAHFLSELKSRSLKVHKELPIRSVIYRSPRSRPFVPAVLNYNRVPMRMLVEVCNLNNPLDRNQIRKADYRQKVADSVVDAIQVVFGNQRPMQVARNKP